MTASDKVQLRKAFYIIALKVLHGPDLELIEIRNILDAAPALSAVSAQFVESLKQLHLNGIGKLLDVVEELKLIVNGEPNQVEKSSMAPNTVLAKTSCIGTYLPYKKSVLFQFSIAGHFLRRFIVFFEKLTFSEVSVLHATFTNYCEEGIVLAQCSPAKLNRPKW